MKKFASFGKKTLCLLLGLCILFVATACNQDSQAPTQEILKEQDFENYLEEVGVTVVKEDKTVSYIFEQDNCEMTYDTEKGDLYYTDEDGTYPLEITDINADGIVSWRIQKEDETLEGEANTAEAPTAQSTLVIAGTGYLVYSFIYWIFQAAVVVTVAGVTCHLAVAVAETLRKHSKSYNYFPAYNVLGNVYVATSVGLTKSKAASRIASGKNVWATSADYARSACVKASPIGEAVWNWHGTRSEKSGYYKHYHAILYYLNNGSYVHTGGHCWYM